MSAQSLDQKNLALEGLRGIAACIVLLMHIAALFYGAVFTVLCDFCRADPKYAFELALAETPFTLLINGHFAVCLFFVISGFALSARYYRTGNVDHIKRMVLTRAFRLGVPVFVTVMLAWGLFTLGLFYHQDLIEVTKTHRFLREQFVFPPDIGEALRTGIFNTLLLGDFRYNGVLWTIAFEFYGALILAFTLALGVRWHGLMLICLLLSVAIGVPWALFLSMFFFGAGMAKIKFTQSQQAENLVLWGPPALGLGIALAAFYPLFDPLLKALPWMSAELRLSDEIRRATLVYAVAAPLTVFGVLYWKKAEVFLSTRWVTALGAHSFSLYLMHMLVLCSFSAWLFKQLLPQGYDIAALITVIATLPVTALVSTLFYRAVDRPVLTLLKRLQR